MRDGSEKDENVPDGMEAGAIIVSKEPRAGSVEDALGNNTGEGDVRNAFEYLWKN